MCPKGIGYKGTQNSDPGFWRKWNSYAKRMEDNNDLSTRSFYSVTVQNDNQLQVFNTRDSQGKPRNLQK